LAISFVLASSLTVYAQEDVRVPDITVFGAAAKSSTLDFVPTVGELSGTRLQRKKQSTVGETLAHETGVTSSQFGPNASRPVIRGMDGDRIRVLQNGTGVLDASAASPDHGVAIDPLVVDRIEIVRGPGALLYGSNAIGGVVNMVTTRIPERLPEKPTGRAEGKLSSTDLGRSAGLGVEAPVGSHWVVHADGSVRGADDYHVPGFARTAEVRNAEPLEPEDKGRVYNSFNHTGSEAVGTSYVFNGGFVGTSFSNYNSKYGTVAERPVHIDMLQQRWDMAGEWRDLGVFKSISAKNTYSHYKHDEMEDGELGTTFKNDGDEARVDLSHIEAAGFSGVFGVQANTFRFSAHGEEAFLPSTDNQTYSLFLFEEKAQGTLRPSFGARFDAAQVRSKDDANFGAGRTKSFDGGSFSLGFLYQLTASDAVVLNGAYTERAPNYEELFANGRHVATRQNEVGDPNLRKERSQSLELSWRHKSAEAQGSLGVFVQDFKDYIALSPSGVMDGDPDEPFEIFNYRAVDARFYGAEAEYRHKLPSLLPGGTLEAEIKGDMVRGINRVTGGNLPRMTPVRESLGLIYKANRFQTDLEIERSERQTRTAPNESRTDAYTLVNVGVEMPIRAAYASLSAFGRINNLFDVEARNHVSVLKDIAPLPGRNFILGVQASF
jgi:iron complex outermembrane receptor protein